jgi:hypothetical protein
MLYRVPDRTENSGYVILMGWPVRRSTLVVLGFLLAGLALRVWWILTSNNGATGEAFRVARAFAEGRGFADAYRAGQGPTAHLLPTTPLLAGLVYSVFGVRAAAAEFILCVWVLTLVFGSYLLFFRAFERLGVPIGGRILSLAYLCLAPAYIKEETRDFRIWEGALAAALLALFLERLLAAEQRGKQSRPHIASLGLLLGILFFVNPPLGLGAGLCALLFAIRHLSLGQTLFAGSIAAVALAGAVIPWAIRNQTQLGEPVLLRSNLGLELAVAQHPAAWSGADRGTVFHDRLYTIHPSLSRAAFARMQAMGGELAYARALKGEALAWMRDHKLAVAGLALRHIRQVVAPEKWQYTTFGSGKYPSLQALSASVAGVLGLAGLGVALLYRRPLWIYPLILFAAPALAFCLFQPVPRYTYLFYALFTYSAGGLLIPLLRIGWLSFLDASLPPGPVGRGSSAAIARDADHYRVTGSGRRR